MNSLEAMLATLVDLSQGEPDGIPWIVGGGFGLYLRHMHLRKAGERTLFSLLPEPRATYDIDLFVRMELLVQIDTVKALQQRIEGLQISGCSACESTLCTATSFPTETSVTY